jgi:hypothetical protein
LTAQQALAESDEVWRRNLELLRRHPDLAAAAQAEPWPVRLEPAADGCFSLRVLANDRWVTVHGRRPADEAAAWALAQPRGAEAAVLVLGVGLGYHLAALRRLRPDATVVGLEPDARLLAALARAVPLDHLLADPGLRLVCGRQLALLSGHVAAICHRGNPVFRVTHYRPAWGRAPEEFLRLERVLLDAMVAGGGSSATIRRFARLWPRNAVANLPTVLEGAGCAALQGAAAGRAAVLVAAGPSLDRNVHLLRHLKGRALLAVVGTALGPVVRAGVEPDLVFSIDGGEANEDHFRRVGPVPCAGFFDVTVYPAVPRYLTGPRFFGVFHPHFADWYAAALGGFPHRYRTGPSVANAALNVLADMGCTDIVLVGQDLAYTDGRTHSRGTAHCRAADRARTLTVPAVGGGTVATSPEMYWMLRQLEEDIRRLPEGVRVWDATGGGALKLGAAVCSLEEVAAALPSGPPEAFPRLLAGLFAAGRAAPARRHRQGAVRALAELAEACRTMEQVAREAARLHLEDGPDPGGRRARRLAALAARQKSLVDRHPLLGFLGLGIEPPRDDASDRAGRRLRSLKVCRFWEEAARELAAEVAGALHRLGRGAAGRGEP